MAEISEKRSILISSSKIFVFQIVGILLSFLLQAILTNVWGESAFGAYTLFISWIAIVSIVTVPGFDSSLVYMLPRKENERGLAWIISVSLRIVLCLVLAFSAVFILFGGYVPAIVSLSPFVRSVFCASLLLFSFSKLWDAVLLGFQDSSAPSFYAMVRNAARILICLALFGLKAINVEALFVAVLLESFVTAAMRVFRFRRLRSGRQNSFRRLAHSESDPFRVSLLRLTIPMFGIGIVGNLYPYLDKVILGASLPLACVGIYRVAESIASLNSVFVTPFVSFWPVISRLYAEKRMKELADSYQTITMVIFLLMIPFTVSLVELSSFVLSIFGSGFIEQGRIVLFILIAGCVVDAIAGPAGAVLKMTRYPKVSLAVSSVMLVVYGVLSIVLIREYGLIGAAIARSAATILENLVNVSLNFFLLGIFPYTADHFILLASGLAIVLARCFLFGGNVTLAGHFLAAGAQVILFYGFAALLMRKRIGALVGRGKTLLRAKGGGGATA